MTAATPHYKNSLTFVIVQHARACALIHTHSRSDLVFCNAPKTRGCV